MAWPSPRAPPTTTATSPAIWRSIARLPDSGPDGREAPVVPAPICRVPEGRAVLVKTLQIGVDATDREINEALYGGAPPGGDFLVIGHESFGQVLEVGPKVTEVVPGDFVSCTVRRPGTSIFDRIG